MKSRIPLNAALSLFIGLFAHCAAVAQAAIAANAQPRASLVPSRVVERVDDARVVRLSGNTHPSARPEFDKGPVDPNKLLERMVLVLKRSPEQEAALAAFNARQYDPQSPDFHHWLHAADFGSLYGPSDADIDQVASWLQNHGFQIYEVSKGRTWIQFTGTVAQVEQAFHVEMHQYLVGGKLHIANDRDPSVPEALFPVITGISSLHDFFPVHFGHPGDYVKRDLKTGTYTLWDPGPSSKTGAAPEERPLAAKGSAVVHPEFGYTDPTTGYQREELTPYDVAAIYNILPLWNASTPINGSGVKVAIAGLSDIEASDLNTYRSSFGLPATTLVTVHSGTDPGIVSGSQGENTEDTEMVSATAPGATIVLVSDVNNATTNGVVTAVTYIVDNEIAPILTMSYGECELDLGTAGNSLYNQTLQQAATSGISAFVAAGDSGSAMCTSQNGTVPYADTYGLAVNGLASTPYATAVGGTDLQWPFAEATTPISTYWNSTNAANGSSAKGYMPEMSWNDTCTNPLLLNVYTAYTSTEGVCNAAINGIPGLVEMGGGAGGESNCTAPTGTTSSTCAGGYAKPSWQAGVTGIPADSKRDLPDVAIFGAYGFQNSTGIPGSALLICQASDNLEDSCDYSNPDYIIYQENGGTSAASPMTAGIMAMIIQQTGQQQGLANPVFYSLASKETFADCNSNTVAAGNTCIFNDVTTGSNAMVCVTGDPNCVTNTSGDALGVLSAYSATTGYDQTTGLGTFNVANLVNAWPTTAEAFAVTLSPASLTFASTTVGSTTAAQTVTIENTGNATLMLTSETLTGTDSSSFVASANTCGATLASGSTCAVSVEFKPAASGALTASLSIVDNTTGSPQLVTLSGTGASASSPAVTLSPTSLTYASTTVGVTTATQTVNVKNSGTGALTLTSETITGTNASSFVISSNNCGASLAAGASCAVAIAFDPTIAESLSASLSVTDNATGSPQTVALTGTGTATLTYTASVSPTSLTYASTTVGVTTAAQTVTVKNSGTGALTLTSETITGTNASSFVISSNNCGASLAAGASCAVAIAFDPTIAGSLSASLSVADNATGSPQTVALTGTGTAALTYTASVSPTSLTYASTTVGSTTAAQTVTVKNSGTGALTLTSETITGTNASSFVISSNNCGASLAAGASCAVAIAFDPTIAGSLSASLSVADNATGSPQTVALTGTGTAALTYTASVSPTSLTYASTTVGVTTAAQTVTVKNSGTGALTLTSETITGTNASSFVISSNNCGTSLAAGASCAVAIAFDPTIAESLSASLSVTDNATGSPQTVALTGTATSPAPATTTTTLSSSNPSVGTGVTVTLTATVTQAAGVPSGTVNFLNGTTSLGTGTLNGSGSASLTTSFSAVGTYSLTAVYEGDAASAQSTSAPLTETVVAVGVTTSVSPSSLTIAAGQSGTLTITLTPTGGYSGTANFSCGTLPAHVSCTFVPPSITIASGSGPVTDTLTISTDTKTTAMLSPPRAGSVAGGIVAAGVLWLPGILILAGHFRRNGKRLSARRLIALGVFCLAIVAAGSMSGCGGTASKDAKPGTYTLPVTITVAGEAVQNVSVTLVVQ